MTAPCPACLALALALGAAPPSAAAEPTRSASGLAYEIGGSGPTVVLLHGSNLDRRLWSQEAARLRGRFRVLTYDLRGHGASARPEAPFSAGGDLAALLDEVGETAVTLVGLSDGARIAVDFALEHPERVLRLLLISPTVGGYRPAELPPFFDDLIAALREQDYDRATQVLLDSPIARVPEESRGLVASMIRDNRDLWTIPPQLQQQLDPPALGRLGELKMPILVAVGSEDLPDVRRQAELIVEAAADARLQVVDGGGHLLNLTSPEAFTTLLEGFLAPLAPAP